MSERKMSRKQAIRDYCLGCCCDSAYEVRKCTAKKCPLYPFRTGTYRKDDVFSIDSEKE